MAGPGDTAVCVHASGFLAAPVRGSAIVRRAASVGTPALRRRPTVRPAPTAGYRPLATAADTACRRPDPAPPAADARRSASGTRGPHRPVRLRSAGRVDPPLSDRPPADPVTPATATTDRAVQLRAPGPGHPGVRTTGSGGPDQGRSVFGAFEQNRTPGQEVPPSDALARSATRSAAPTARRLRSAGPRRLVRGERPTGRRTRGPQQRRPAAPRPRGTPGDRHRATRHRQRLRADGQPRHATRRRRRDPTAPGRAAGPCLRSGRPTRRAHRSATTIRRRDPPTHRPSRPARGRGTPSVRVAAARRARATGRRTRGRSRNNLPRPTPQSPARASGRATASARVAPPSAPTSPEAVQRSGPPYTEFTTDVSGRGRADQAAPLGPPGQVPDQYSEHTTDISGRGRGRPAVRTGTGPAVHACDTPARERLPAGRASRRRPASRASGRGWVASSRARPAVPR